MDPLFLLALPPLVVAWFFWTELKGAGWQPMPAVAVEKALALAKVGRADVVYDLGAGDGRVIVASVKKGAQAIGIEIDPLRYLMCKLRFVRMKNARAVFSDLFNVPLTDATVVFIYLRNWSTEKLRSKLLSELQPGTRIVTYHWKISGWHPIAKDEKNDIYLYRA